MSDLLVNDLHKKWLDDRKKGYHRAATRVLLEHGILGTFVLLYSPKETWYAQVQITEASSVSDILFNDPKLQFVYKLKGGNNHFMPLFKTEYEKSVTRNSKIVVGIAKEYIDDVGNWND